MFQHIMVATDFSSPAMAAADAARELAKAMDARVTLLHVIDRRLSASEAVQALQELGEERFGGVRKVDVAAVEGQRTALVLCKEARERGADLIVAGRHGEHTFAEWLIGTTTERVARHASSALFVAHPALREPIALRHIVVGVDFSPSSLAALRSAADLARKLDSFVTLAHVYDLFPPVEILEEPYGAHENHSFRGILTDKLEALRKAELDGVPTDIVVARDKSTVNALCNLASERSADLIVLGTHGLSGVERALLGSVAERVMRHAPCAVLVVR